MRVPSCPIHIPQTALPCKFQFSASRPPDGSLRSGNSPCSEKTCQATRPSFVPRKNSSAICLGTRKTERSREIYRATDSSTGFFEDTWHDFAWPSGDTHSSSRTGDARPAGTDQAMSHRTLHSAARDGGDPFWGRIVTVPLVRLSSDIMSGGLWLFIP